MRVFSFASLSIFFIYDANDLHFSPISVNLKYSNEAIRRLIGPLGALKRKIEEETGLGCSSS